MASSSRISLFVSLVTAALLCAAAWYWLGRPVDIAEPAIEGTLSCLSYTPYRAGETPFVEAPLNAANVDEDLGLLARRTSCIRVYASGGMEQIPALAQKHGLKVLMGAWVSSSEQATRKEIETLVQLANAYPQTITGVLVGNEALLRREITADRLTALIREVKSRVKQPVSYADVWEYQLRNPQVGEASDFVTVHILPYWEDQPVAIDNAIDHVRDIRKMVVERFPGKRVLIGESGWPSVGRMREGALPSVVNEARYVRGFVAAAHAEGWDYNLIEAFDQPWKRYLEGAVGGYWGIFDAARQDKGLFSGPVSNHPNWQPMALFAFAVAALLILVPRLSIRLVPLAALAAVGWSLQLEQLWLVVRDVPEEAAALLLLAVLLVASLASVARLGARPLAPRVEAVATLAAGSLAAIFTLWLAFDPRYRDFFTAGFLPPALMGLLLLRARPPVVRAGAEETAIGGLLGAGAVAVIVGEKLTNWQGLAWSFTCLALAASLLARGMLARRAA